MNHELDIVIVNSNSRDALRDCLASVYRNLGQLDANVIVFDNCSTDTSQEMLRTRFPQVTLIASDKTLSVAAANNAAINTGSAPYVLLLNAGTVVVDDVLTKSVNFMRRHGDVGAMGCQSLNNDRSFHPPVAQFPSLFTLSLRAVGLKNLGESNRHSLQRTAAQLHANEHDVETIAGCYMLVRRKALNQIGLLDEAFFYGEEADWCLRLKAGGWRVCLPQVGDIIHHGRVVTENNSHQRDLFFASGLVRLHHKHSGVAVAALAWLILLAFNANRLLYWTARMIVDRKPIDFERLNHFVGVVRNYNTSWPTARAA